MTEPKPQQAKALHLRYPIPGFGSEFIAGVNCSAIEARATGWLIREPRTLPGRELHADDIIATDGGWLRVVRHDYRCDVCSQGFTNASGLNGHRWNAHKLKKGETGDTTQTKERPSPRRHPEGKRDGTARGQ